MLKQKLLKYIWFMYKYLKENEYEYECICLGTNELWIEINSYLLFTMDVNTGEYNCF